MSAITAPAPSSVETPTPPKTDAIAHRTVLGFVATRRIVEIILTLILGVGGGLLLFGSHFGLNMVHTQLAAQDISFPAKGSPGPQPRRVPRPAALRRPEGRHRAESQGLRQRVHQPPPRRRRRRQDLLTGERRSPRPTPPTPS